MTGPIALNGSTLAAFTVDQPGDTYGRVTVCREPDAYVVRLNGAERLRCVDPLDAVAYGLGLAGWLEPLLDNFETVDT